MGTEIVPELPLPTSTCISGDVQLFPSQHDAAESMQLLANFSHSSEQIDSFERLLTNVNNAYLDFKNPTHNRPSVINDIPQLPPIIHHVTQKRPDIFQPQFDAYHGSPLKTDNVSALAYSPSHRNTFIMQQQQQQHQQQQQNSFLLQKNPPSCVSSQSFSSNSPHTIPVAEDGDNNNHNNIHNSSPYSQLPLLNNTSNGVLHHITEIQTDNNANNDKVLLNGELDISQLVPPDNEMDDIGIHIHKKKKKKHKQKRKKAGKDENGEIIFQGENDQKVTLKLQKLIVRKVKEGDEEDRAEVVNGNAQQEDRILDIRNEQQ